MRSHRHVYARPQVHRRHDSRKRFAHCASRFYDSRSSCSWKFTGQSRKPAVKTPKRAHLRLELGGDESLTGPVEDYQKAIYEIGRGTVAVATNDIAQRLD